MTMNDSLTTQAAAQLVPASYAEKAMASLMQLHSELMDEKERRVDLFRRLMEREQVLAELKMYVKVLEDRLGPAASAAEVPQGVKREDATSPAFAPEVVARPPLRREPPRAPVPPQVASRNRVEGWKTW
jgi:hypothetical protein